MVCSGFIVSEVLRNTQSTWNLLNQVYLKSFAKQYFNKILDRDFDLWFPDVALRFD
jgi:hypothetical protein